MFFVLIGDSIAFCVFRSRPLHFPRVFGRRKRRGADREEPQASARRGEPISNAPLAPPALGTPVPAAPLRGAEPEAGGGGAWPPRLLGSLHPPAENGLPVPTRRRAGEAASRSPAVRSRSAVVVDFLMTRNDGSRHKAVLLAPKSNRCCFNCSYKKDKQFF